MVELDWHLVHSKYSFVSKEDGPVADSEEYDISFANRTFTKSPEDGFRSGGALILPQSFGSIHLGESFTAYISLGNQSPTTVANIHIKIERYKHSLYDNSSKILEALEPVSRHDIVVTHDLKDLGQHTLVCTATYHEVIGDRRGEKKYLNQYFKFHVTNPVSVKTKARTVNKDVFLEVGIENCTKDPLYVEYVKLIPSPQYSQTQIEAMDLVNERRNHKSDDKSDLAETMGNLSLEDYAGDDVLSNILSKLVILKPSGGIRNYLYRLTKRTDGAAASPDAEQKPNTLGKLEMKWRRSMGESGRLQTQPIIGAAVPVKEINTSVLHQLTEIPVQTPTKITIRIQNRTDVLHKSLMLSNSGIDSEWRIGFAVGKTVTLGDIGPKETKDVEIDIIGLAPGIQKLAGVTLLSSSGRVFDTLQTLEVMVSRNL